MCIDSTSVIWCVRGNASDSSQWAFHKCQDAMQSHDIRVKWCPGHMGIEGNMEADVLAGEAADPERPIWADDLKALQPTASGVRSYARAIKSEAAALWWARKSTLLSERYRQWALDYKICTPKELALPRATLHRLLALRSGHGDFKWYHEKFKHENAVLECLCGRAKTPDHLVHCRLTQQYLYKWPLKPATAPRTREAGHVYLKALQASPK